MSAPAIAAGRRVADEPLVLGDPVPVAEVLEEPAGVVGPAGDDAARAGVGEVALDAGGDQGDLVGRERAAHAHGAVAAVVVDQRRERGRTAMCAERVVVRAGVASLENSVIEPVTRRTVGAGSVPWCPTMPSPSRTPLARRAALTAALAATSPRPRPARPRRPATRPSGPCARWQVLAPGWTASNKELGRVDDLLRVGRDRLHRRELHRRRRPRRPHGDAGCTWRPSGAGTGKLQRLPPQRSTAASTRWPSRPAGASSSSAASSRPSERIRATTWPPST